MPTAQRAKLTNTSNARYDGDAIRLAANNLVENIHIDNSLRSAILGINAVGRAAAEQPDDQHHGGPRHLRDRRAYPVRVHGRGTCAGEWPNGYILFAPQTNHFGAITLVTCGPGRAFGRHDRQQSRRPAAGLLQVPRSSGRNAFRAPATWSISGNVIRDSNSDGIMIIDDLGVQATATVTDNVIKDLSQTLPDPWTVGITDHVVRSRGFTHHRDREHGLEPDDQPT